MMTGRPSVPTILCGDFNSPEVETVDGPVPFSTGGKRQYDAEMSVLIGLEASGLFDVFRQLHGEVVDLWSYVDRQGGRERRRRFDHVFASSQLRPTSAAYLTDWQIANLSDHAGVLVEFAVVGATPVDPR
jgi:endonuclease/exonuclease/phosphatase family metal-dependent hydrolase